jgi:hypothetical protein
LVIAPHLDLSAEFPEILNQVVGKGIVVVENENHRDRPVFSLHPNPGRTLNQSRTLLKLVEQKAIPSLLPTGTGHLTPQGWY